MLRIALLALALVGCSVYAELCNVNAFKNVEMELFSDTQHKHKKAFINGCLSPEKLTIAADVIHAKHQDIPQLTEGSFKDLTGIKEISLESTKTLEIFPRAFKGLPNLLQVRINKCPLTKISKGVFDNSSIELLDLRKNQIDTIADKAFANMPNLRVVKLSENKITTWNRDWFLGSHALRMLDFGNNKIDILPENAFLHTQQLTEVNIKDNLIRKIHPEAFKGLTVLRDLILKYNVLEIVESNTFSGLTSLVKLDLGHNRIASIQNGAFKELKNLTFFYLLHNNLESLDKAIFPAIVISTLDISHNRIQTLDHTFPDGFSVNVLHISSNRLNYISESTLDNLGIGVLNYYPNPFTCACLDKFIAWINLHDIVVPRTIENCLRDGHPVCVKKEEKTCKEVSDDSVTKLYMGTPNMCMLARYP